MPRILKQAIPALEQTTFPFDLPTETRAALRNFRV